MNKTYLLIGGNLGNRLVNIEQAIKEIKKIPANIVERSNVYETEAWGNLDQPAFLNLVLHVDTKVNPQELLKALLGIEENLGRKRTTKFAPRTIDIDILFFNDEIIATPQLSIPHPEIQNRRFALAPLVELAPHLQHPQFKKTVTTLLQECTDPLEVKIYSC